MEEHVHDLDLPQCPRFVFDGDTGTAEVIAELGEVVGQIEELFTLMLEWIEVHIPFKTVCMYYQVGTSNASEWTHSVISRFVNKNVGTCAAWGL